MPAVGMVTNKQFADPEIQKAFNEALTGDTLVDVTCNFCKVEGKALLSTSMTATEVEDGPLIYFCSGCAKNDVVDPAVQMNKSVLDSMWTSHQGSPNKHLHIHSFSITLMVDPIVFHDDVPADHPFLKEVSEHMLGKIEEFNSRSSASLTQGARDTGDKVLEVAKFMHAQGMYLSVIRSLNKAFMAAKERNRKS